jgi:hypothetical protein
MQPAKGTNPPRTYRVEVIFSLHCFTRGLDNEIPDQAMLYSDTRETRVFDFRRYELSRRLPGIVADLPQRTCYGADRRNFFIFEMVNQKSGDAQQYEVYFTASRSTKKDIINLFLQSAYTRDAKHAANRPQMKPISFHAILWSALNGR